MARIPEAEVQRLKDEIAVQRLVEAAGIELKKVGKDIAGRCPFHDDSEPSLIVTPVFRPTVHAAPPDHSNPRFARFSFCCRTERGRFARNSNRSA